MIVAAIPSTLTGRFALIIEGLCRVITARCAAAGDAGDTARVVIFFLVWDRLRRITVRFAALAGQLRTGTLRYRVPSLLRDRDRADTGWDKDLRYKPERLPNHFGWLLELAPEADDFRGLLQDLLQVPEFAGLLQSVTQVERLLSPLFRMLGVQVPESPVIWKPIQVPNSPDTIVSVDPSSSPATLSGPAGWEPELRPIAQGAGAPPRQPFNTHPPPSQALVDVRERDGRRSRQKP